MIKSKCLLYFMFLFIIFNITSCSQNKKVTSINSIANVSDPLIYLKSKGYDILTDVKKLESRKITKDDFKGINSIIWGAQTFTPEQINGKMVDYYYADVKDHPLLNNQDIEGESVRVTIMKNDNKIIGGYSSINYKEIRFGANIYSIDGKTLEEFTGQDFQTWREEWERKYN